MRYNIIDSFPSESFFIDAPYDCKADALDAIAHGVKHSCAHCKVIAFHDDGSATIECKAHGINELGIIC